MHLLLLLRPRAGTLVAARFTRFVPTIPLNLGLTYDYARSQGSPILGDRLLTRALTNLLDNARGAGARAISLSAEDEGGAEVAVRLPRVAHVQG